MMDLSAFSTSSLFISENEKFNFPRGILFISLSFSIEQEGCLLQVLEKSLFNEFAMNYCNAEFGLGFNNPKFLRNFQIDERFVMFESKDER